ncbi:MAG: hypothetical protein FJY83_02035 [Candidatus Aminicenantes bacterium]|nr:hypothetical protein [Candidatus Aminicenantes bacterium]
MDMIIYETPFKYERWAKFFMGLPVVLMFAAGLILSGVVRIPGLNPAGLEKELRLVAWIFFASAAFILFIYWLVLPTKIFIYQDKLKVKFGLFFWTIRFETIERAVARRGFPLGPGHNSVTSYRNQIEIARRGRLPVRLSPDGRDEFLSHLNRALEDWGRAYRTK